MMTKAINLLAAARRAFLHSESADLLTDVHLQECEELLAALASELHDLEDGGNEAGGNTEPWLPNLLFPSAWLESLLPSEVVTVSSEASIYTDYTGGALVRQRVDGPPSIALPTLARRFADLEAASAADTLPAARNT